ncbi:MAG: hypothetical protein HC781_07600 [Leptolyngbyaceae cyanobacterium CSU_1_4]|nr:hypothetical protein [Leptolyngbyaceae cyanobacterium CSU_1_4]
MQLFWVLPAQALEILLGVVGLGSRQTIQKRETYPEPQADRVIAFASKIKNSVQKFLEKPIAPLVERNLYPERSL